MLIVVLKNAFLVSPSCDFKITCVFSYPNVTIFLSTLNIIKLFYALFRRFCRILSYESPYKWIIHSYFSMYLFKSRPLSLILYCAVVSISVVMSQTSELSSHYQHRPRMTMCQGFGKDAKKKKGWADWVNCRHVQFTEKCGHLEKGVCCYEASLQPGFWEATLI